MRLFSERHLDVAFSLAIGGALGGVLMAGFVQADGASGDPATESIESVLPYRGSLLFDGTGFDGSIDLRFSLVDDAGTEVWAEEHTDDAPPVGQAAVGQVRAYAGEMKVYLGRGRALESSILDAEPLSVRVNVRDPADPTGMTWKSLGGEQRLGSVPWSIWTSAATNLDVAGTISVGPDADSSDASLSVRDNMRDAPDAKFRHVNIDSRDPAAISTITAGATYDSTSGEYLYDSDRGATRVRLGDSASERFSVSISSHSSGQATPGDPVTWSTPLLVDGAGRLGIQNTSPSTAVDVAGTLTGVRVDLGTAPVDVTSFSASGNIDVEGHFLLNGAKPIIFGTVEDAEGNVRYNLTPTGVSASDYHCIVGSWRNERSGSTVMRSLYYRTLVDLSSNTWKVAFNYGDSIGDEADIAWICFHNDLVQVSLADASCGNGVCDFGEKSSSCVVDCAVAADCGNGRCEASLAETRTSCPSDCVWFSE